MFNIEEFEFYKKYEEWYYHKDAYNVTHNYAIGDIVMISNEIEANIGYKNQIGIVQGLSGVNNYLYVMAYCTQANRYWVCGFKEEYLKPLNIFDLTYNTYDYKRLFEEFVDWTYRNDIKLSTREFKEMHKRYKNGENVFQ